MAKTVRNPSVVFTEPKKVAVENVPMPKAGPGQVVVKARRSLISTGTECTILKGEFPKDSAWAAWAKFPFIPGYAMSVGKEREQSPCFIHVIVAPIVG